MNIVKAGSLDPITTEGVIPVDGVTCVSGDLIFAVDTIYRMVAGSWPVAASDFDCVFILEGDTNRKKYLVFNGTEFVYVNGPYK